MSLEAAASSPSEPENSNSFLGARPGYNLVEQELGLQRFHNLNLQCFCQGEDSFELHSVDLELEAVEKQIRDLQVKQAQLRQRKAALESSRTDAHLSQINSRRETITPTTSTPCASLPRPSARTRPAQVSFTPAPGYHAAWMQQQRKTRAKPRARTSPPPPPPVFEIPTQNRFAPLRETECDTVIIGDSIVRHVRATAAKGKVHTRCLPGARVLDVSAQVPAILKKNIGAVVLHAGTNNIRLRQTEILKKDFRSLVELVRTTSPTTRIIVSGPLPTFQRGIESTNFIPDRSRPGLTTTAIGAVDLQGAGGNWATVGRRSRGGRRVHRQREKRKGKSVGLRIGTLNVGTMTGKGRELADMMERRKVDILCVQETRWKGSKARSIGAGFKLFYYGVDSKRNGVGVVLKEEFVRNVLEVKRVSDRVMSLKLEIEGVMLNVVSGYAPQVGCELEEKERFWSELDEAMERIPTGERVVIGADFNGHVGEGNTGDEEVMGKFGVKERNFEGQMVVDFAKRMDMGVVNT
ncbi:hypothetical protein QTP86_002955 [Hemibagrus guttatus]|nr:hypothetical protein QTP86_002955 [Hemibagrus guttatus]